jgi:hypothetical protein
VRPFAAPGAYVNYLGSDEGVDGIKAAYGAKVARLTTLKTKFDPENLFRMNQNIAPALVGASPRNGGSPANRSRQRVTLDCYRIHMLKNPGTESPSKLTAVSPEC